MASPQITVGSSARTSADYINDIYEADAVSKLIQIPSSKRVCKIAGTPVGGQVLTFIQQQGGTLENPDVLGFQSVGAATNLLMRTNTNAVAQTLDPALGLNLSFPTTAFDNTGGNVSAGPVNFTLSSVAPIYYTASVNILLSRPSSPLSACTVNLYLYSFDAGAVIATVIGAQSVAIPATSTADTYWISCDGSMQRAAAAGSYLYAYMDVTNVVGPPVPSISITSARISIQPSLL